MQPIAARQRPNKSMGLDKIREKTSMGSNCYRTKRPPPAARTISSRPTPMGQTNRWGLSKFGPRNTPIPRPGKSPAWRLVFQAPLYWAKAPVCCAHSVKRKKKIRAYRPGANPIKLNLVNCEPPPEPFMAFPAFRPPEPRALSASPAPECVGFSPRGPIECQVPY